MRNEYLFLGVFISDSKIPTQKVCSRAEWVHWYPSPMHNQIWWCFDYGCQKNLVPSAFYHQLLKWLLHYFEFLWSAYPISSNFWALFIGRAFQQFYFRVLRRPIYCVCSFYFKICIYECAATILFTYQYSFGCIKGF